MSSEVSQQNNSLLSSATSAVTSSAIMTGGFGSLSAVRRYGKDAFKKTKLNNDTIKTFLKKNNNKADFFTKGYATAKNYEELSRARKELAKFEKITGKESGITFFQKIKKVFTNKDYKALNIENYNKAKEFLEGNAKAGIEGLEAKLKRGIDVSEITSKSLGKNLGGLFKSELKDPFGIFFAGAEFVERFTSQALPAFKEKGVGEGIKETLNALGAGVATWAADAGLSIVFRTVGAAVGSFLGPIGASVGSTIGNAIGGMLSWNIVEKIFPKKEQPEEQIQAEDIKTAQAQPQVQAQPAFQSAKNVNNLNVDENLLTDEQIKKLAYAQVFPKYGANKSQLQKYYA